MTLMKYAAALAALTFPAGVASASPLTLDFDTSATGCATDTLIAGVVTVEDGRCVGHDVDKYQYLEFGEELIIQAQPGVTFDYQGADILYFGEELFKIPVADLPNGLDLTDPDDIFYVNFNWLWEPSIGELPLLSVKGFSEGSLVQEWSSVFPDTDAHNLATGYAPTSLDWDLRDFPGGPMSGLDRLEIGFGLHLADAYVETPQLLNDVWYGHLKGSLIAFDDLRLDVTGATPPTPPTPVPLPVSGVLLSLGLAGLWGFGRKQG